jgi:hypothetical protein
MQVEVGSFATSYIPSDTRFTSRSSVATYYDETGILRTAPANSPRYGYKYDGRKWVETGLILENAATNYVLNHRLNANVGSYRFVNTSYNATTAPDGSETGTLITNTSDNNPGLFLSLANNTSTRNYTMSIWAKAGNADNVHLELYQNGVGNGTLVNYGIISGPGTITPGTGVAYVTGLSTTKWTRFYITCSLVSGNVNPAVKVREATAVNGESAYIWGTQVEIADSYSSLIKTEGASLTRSADVASSVAYTRAIDVAKINNITNKDWYNTREGSIYTDFYPIGVSDAVVVGVGDGTSRGFRAPWITSDTQLRLGTWSGTSYSALDYYNSITVVSPHKSALSFSYEDSTFISSLDGSTAAVTSSWPGVETDATTIWIGGETDSNRPYNGHIEKVSIYNEALSTAEIQALTENN